MRTLRGPDLPERPGIKGRVSTSHFPDLCLKNGRPDTFPSTLTSLTVEPKPSASTRMEDDNFWGGGSVSKQSHPSPSKEIESFPCTVKSKRMGPRGLYSSDSMGGSPHRTRRNCKQLSSSSLSLHRPIIGYYEQSTGNNYFASQSSLSIE